MDDLARNIEIYLYVYININLYVNSFYINLYQYKRYTHLSIQINN